MKNEDIVNSDIENILKTKMNELSDSVDCFDRISARAFPQEKQEFSDDDGYTICDLENITGRSNKFRFLKWTAVAASVAACIAVIPQTNIAQRIFANLGMGSVKKSYQNIITEINKELDTGDYISIDVPFDQYAENDVLVTPLFPCPFEDCGKEDATVRLYIKQYEGYSTTQIYAVLYEDTYSENNIIAAAVSNFRFNERELSDIINKDAIAENQASLADDTFAEVNLHFVCMDDGTLCDRDGNTVSLASFQYTVITKTESGAELVTSNILYGHGDDSTYFYDINTLGTDNKFPERDKMWKKSVYFNGNSAFPKESYSNFTRTEIFDSNDTGDNSEVVCEFIYPYDSMENYKYGYADIDIPPEFRLFGSNNNVQMCSAFVPSLPESYISMKMYYSPLDSENYDQYEKMILIAYFSESRKEIFRDIIIHEKYDSEAEIQKQREEELRRQSELEALKQMEEDQLQLSIDEANL